MGGFQRNLRLWLILTSIAIVAGCGASVWATPLSALPRYRLAQERWLAHDIHHYRMIVHMSQGWLDNGPWTLEVLDERVLAGYNTSTGAPLNVVQLKLAQLRTPVSKLFAMIKDDLTFSRSLNTQLARVLPVPLRGRLDRCAPRMPRITYDPDLGYPSAIVVYASPCFIHADWTISVLELTPLP